MVRFESSQIVPPADMALRSLVPSSGTSSGIPHSLSFPQGWYVQTHRSQYLNRQEAVERLVEMVRKATIRPKKRKATKPTKNSQKKRMDSKTRRGKVKALRGKVRDD